MLKHLLETLDELRSEIWRSLDNETSTDLTDIRKSIKTTKKDIVKELEKLGYKNNVKSLLKTNFNISFTGEDGVENINYETFKPKFYYENNKHILIFGDSVDNFYCVKSRRNTSMELAYIIDKETNSTIYETWSVRADHKLKSITNYLISVANRLYRYYNFTVGE